MDLELLRLLALVAVGAFALVAARRAMGEAAVGYFRVREGVSPNPRADMGMVWVVTLASLSGVLLVAGSFLQVLARALR